jgi:hypothetical protein
LKANVGRKDFAGVLLLQEPLEETPCLHHAGTGTSAVELGEIISSRVSSLLVNQGSV